MARSEQWPFRMRDGVGGLALVTAKPRDYLDDDGYHHAQDNDDCHRESQGGQEQNHGRAQAAGDP